MTIPEMVAAAIREVLVCAMRNAEPYEYQVALDELARLFGIDMEAMLKELE